jgi:hypothetical protein
VGKMMNPWEATENFVGEVKVYYDNLTKHFSRFRNKVFVETGTYIGNGLQTALTTGFEKCYSIEIHKYLYDNAMKRFEKEIESEKVELFFGNSEEIFPTIIEKLDCPATFWLDAHISSQYGEKLAKNCPVIEELEAIKKHSIKTHTILIDDINCFNNPAHDNIPLGDVRKILTSINENYKFEFLDASIRNNILVAYI